MEHQEHHEHAQQQMAAGGVKMPSTIGMMARGALGLAIGGAVLGGVIGAAVLGGMSLAGFPAAVEALAGVMNLGSFAAAGTGSAAIAGLALGSAGGALMGAPAGAVAAPMYMKQKVAEMENAQLKAAMPMVAQRSAEQAVSQLVEQARQQYPQFDNPGAKTGHVDDLVAKRGIEQQQGQETGRHV